MLNYCFLQDMDGGNQESPRSRRNRLNRERRSRQRMVETEEQREERNALLRAKNARRREEIFNDELATRRD